MQYKVIFVFDASELEETLNKLADAWEPVAVSQNGGVVLCVLKSVPGAVKKVG
jgi:hypothetical protein